MKKLLTTFFFLSLFAVFSAISQNVVIVIIDGARYPETFLNENSTYTPKMWELAKEGTYIKFFYNDSLTYTSAAIPALWCGTWTARRDTFYNGSSTQYSVKPSLFEYFRKQKNIPVEKCLYSLSYVSSLWLQSFNSVYGPDFWPYTISSGTSDNDVLQNTLNYMESKHPQFTVMYLSNVDHAGHSGIWSNYVSAISNADQIVYDFWNTIQQDVFYSNKTTMIVTNDHGRHDDAHGGFSGHGDGCPGCRQIMFLALGPNVKENYVSTKPRRIPDVAVTAGSLLGVNMEYSTGEVASEIFESTGIAEQKIPLNWQITPSEIQINIQKKEKVSLSVFDLNGRKLKDLMAPTELTGTYIFSRPTVMKSGILIYRLTVGSITETKKVISQ